MSKTEKRLFRTRRTITKALEANLGRAMRERMVLQKVPKALNDKELSAITSCCRPCEGSSKLCLTFELAGSTGNSYKVSLDYKPKCSCPNFHKKEDICKHIMHVLVNIVGLPRASPLVFQKALLSKELAEIHNNLAHNLPKLSISASTERPTRNERCNECSGSVRSHHRTVVCPACRCIFHEECFGMLSSMAGLNLHSNHRPTDSTEAECPCCSTGFDYDPGYENVAHLTGQSRRRDRSSYHPTPGYPGYSGYR